MVDYLSERDEPTEEVRCPVHGFIHYSRHERDLIDHWVFQRLRHVRQLAMTYLVYPGAMHSRFEHSLGVMELATRAFERLCGTEYRDRIEDQLKQVPELRDKTLAKARQVLRLFALLHDVGHPAFSHAAEKYVPGGDHEQITVFVITNILRNQLDGNFFAGVTDLLERLMQKSPELTFLRQFVASEIDMDRTDYLRRDSLHCGVNYGVFDSLRLIESLAVMNNPDTGALQLAVERGGEHTFEALILARYQMSTQVYYHRIRRIYDYYLSEYMRHWAVDHYKTPEDVLHYDDNNALLAIRLDEGTATDRGKWANRIVRRQHHRSIYETGDNADLDKLKKAKRILRELTKEFDNVDFYLDDSPLPIHKLAIPGQQEEQEIEDLYVVDKHDHYVKLTHDSAIISKIPKRVRNVRIFADANEDTLKAVAQKVAELERTQ